jgi:hypothetical protein
MLPHVKNLDNTLLELGNHELALLTNTKTDTTTTVHFGNFVTARGAKSIISPKCVFNPSCGFPGVFKIKISYLDLIFDHIWPNYGFRRQKTSQKPLQNQCFSTALC